MIGFIRRLRGRTTNLVHWGWCEGHDSALFAGPKGMICPWVGQHLITQNDGTPIDCSPFWVEAHVTILRDRPLQQPAWTNSP